MASEAALVLEEDLVEALLEVVVAEAMFSGRVVQVAMALETNLAEVSEQAKVEMVAPAMVMAPVVMERQVATEEALVGSPEPWEEVTAVGMAVAINNLLVSSPSYGKQREE